MWHLYLKNVEKTIRQCIYGSVLILQIYKNSQFNNIKIKNSKIQVQNKTQTLRKSYTFLNKVFTRRGHIDIDNNDNNNDNNNNNDKNNYIYIYVYIYIYIYIYIDIYIYI